MLAVLIGPRGCGGSGGIDPVGLSSGGRESRRWRMSFPTPVVSGAASAEALISIHGGGALPR